VAKVARPAISAWRKVLYAAVVVLVVLGAAEGVSRLLWVPEPQRKGTFPSLQIYLDSTRHDAVNPRAHLDRRLPGPRDPGVIMRVPEKTAGAVDFIGGGGEYLLTELSRLPGERRVLVFGGSAAWGPSFDYPKTFAAVTEQGLRRRLADPALRVLNLARPGWELNRITELMLHVVETLPRAPAAVILLSGNNELLHVEQLRAVGVPTAPPLALYSQLTRQLGRLGLLGPPPGTDPNSFLTVQADPFTPQQISQRIWRPGRGMEDASYWPAIRRAYVSRYRHNLRRIAARLRRAKIPLVLVPPPINLHYFPGGMHPQPVTFDKVGRAGYLRRSLRLERALKKHTIKGLEALVRDLPGPLQRFALGQLYDAAGRRREAFEQLMAARDDMMGVLESLPTMTASAISLHGNGVAVIDTRSWYRDSRPVRQTALEMFVDSCHLTDDGHKRLAKMIVEALTGMLPR